MERPGQTDRKTSFNPEATAFNPVATPVKQADVPASSPGAFDDEFSRLSGLPSHDSPLRSAKNPRSPHGTEDDHTHGSCSMQNQLASSFPMSTPTGSLGDSSTDHAQSSIGTSQFQPALPHHTFGFRHPQLSSNDFPPLPTAPNFPPIDIDELSAGLGLPSAKNDTDFSGTPKRSHKTRPSQDVQNALYGKLIDKALNKPLTANALAQYLSRSPSGSSDETIRAFPKHEQTPRGQVASSNEHEPPLKVVLPPPGFANQMPRMVTVEDEAPPTEPALMRQQVAQAIAPDYLKQFTKQPQPNSSSERHARRPSTRRRPRVYTRTKRTDQGPEPSAADIYPDDANWIPGLPVHHSNYAPGSSPHVAAPPQEVVRPEDPTSWPTPAEVHKHKQKPRALVPTPAHIPQIFSPAHHVFDPVPQKPEHAPQSFDIFGSHFYPSAEDMNAADTEVLSLIDELPDPTITTLINFGAFDLIADDRPLSPSQQTGKRYGLNYYGIGLGDNWHPPRVATSASFELPVDLPGYKTVWKDEIKSGWSDASWQ